VDDQIFKAVAEVIATHFMVPVDVVKPDTTAMDIDGWDSVSHTMLILEIEERLGIMMPPDKANKLKNVGHLAEAIESLKL
jgi:acyl carrier protein